MIDAGPSLSAAGQKNNTEKLAVLGIWILIAYAIVRSLFAAASKPFWYDEVCTLIVARQPSVSAIWRALAQPADGQPPPFYLVERAAAALLHNPQIAFRLPSICGFACTLVCVFILRQASHRRAYTRSFARLHSLSRSSTIPTRSRPGLTACSSHVSRSPFSAINARRRRAG